MSNAPLERVFQASGARITYFDWDEGNAQAHAVFFIHATGFHARCWDQTIAALPAGYRAIAMDMRGHGRSEKTGLMSDWSIVARDASELVAHLDLKGAIGVGHSMGGHTVVQVAAHQPQAFARLLLVDPVMMAPEMYASGSRFAGIAPQDHPVARRRNAWDSWEQMFEHLRNRHPYSLWRQDVLADYCRYGLVPKAGGPGLELACPPIVEASIYVGSAGRDIYDLARTVEAPVTVLRAKPRAADTGSITDFASSPTWEKVAGIFPRGRDVPLPHLTHFIPMQDPVLTARFVVEPDYVPA